ncbi:MAG: glycine--tRNA ligase subunit beta [Caulobacteraceae bacterium]
MPQFLLEFLSEEVPARMQAGAARDLERMARERLTAAELDFDTLRTFAGPRRLSLFVDGLPGIQRSRIEERKGPRVGAPSAAIEGFLRSTGATRDELVQRDGVWFASLRRGGGGVGEILAEMTRSIAAAFPWPKAMVSAAGTFRWVRPLRGLLCIFDGEVIPLCIDGVTSGAVSAGHRFMGSRDVFPAPDFAAYSEGLERHCVVLEADRRKALILDGARALCADRGLQLVEDAGLLEEVAGMTEWPVPLLGDIDPNYLDLPPEVIRTSMRVHQRYFAVRQPADGSLAPHFIVTANIDAIDGGRQIAAGAARVLAARLADARFFWLEDRRSPLASRLPALEGVTFHAKLGSLRDRVERIEALAKAIAPLVGAEPAAASLAARLCKADLTTAMVGEFPELQGVMGAYYAQAEGQPTDIVEAIRDHYRPLGPSDGLPRNPVAIAVALADKLDTLTAFFEAGEKPTGSRDPYALRRAALGVIRIILESGARTPLRPLIAFAGVGSAIAVVGVTKTRLDGLSYREAIGAFPDPAGELAAADKLKRLLAEVRAGGAEAAVDFWRRMADTAWIEDVLGFILERLKAALREEGLRPDVCQAAFALGDDDPVRLAGRAHALQAFLSTEDGASLLGGYKRAGNILQAEARKAPLPLGEPRLMAEAPGEEKALMSALDRVREDVRTALAGYQFAGALSSLAMLRAPVDAFFDRVYVNAADSDMRDNRLRLLSAVCEIMRTVADFSAIAGAGEGG